MCAERCRSFRNASILRDVAFVPLLLSALLWWPSSVAAAEGIRIAVAANFIQAAKELTADFEKQSGIKVEATFSSSGNLYAQIANGAPYDLFLSADEERPDRLFKEGAAEKPFVYARSRVVLWSARKEFCKPADWRLAVADQGVRRIAIANPETAPYGTAVRTALQKAALWESGEGKRVVAQTIAQAFQYASTEAVDGAFCAFSSVLSEPGRKGCHYEVPEAPEIIQSACILKQTKNRAGAERFAAFLLSAPAVAVKEKYGYR
ncbi:MAG: molybdate ABC transporter substrate-binding protein [Deltaproteobacteria bacterium]|nr:molybdate ABC transporter substrate-binding protein [Deltaproteobacteria bacterium]